MYVNRGASVTAVDLRLDHLAVATRYAATPEEWPVAPRFNPMSRWYQRLHVADDHEVWLLTWLPGQGTDLHDHGGSTGAFHVFAGTLTEDTLTTPAGGPPRVGGRGAGRRPRPPVRQPAHPPDHQPLVAPGREHPR